jgi:outer membrane immunogenic protein
MKRMLLVGATISLAASLYLLASAAHAADVPIAKAPGASVKITQSWTGFYAGVHGGYGLNILSADKLLGDDGGGGGGLSPFPIDAKAISERFLYGARVGFDYELSKHLVVGVVADISRGGGRGQATVPPINDVTTGFLATSKIGTSWTVRGKVGYLADKTLIFGTAGVAYAKNTMSSDSSLDIGVVTKSHTGWVAGVGIETLLLGDWRLGVEYRYLSLGTKEYCNSSNQQCHPFKWRGQQGLVTLNYQF